MIFYHTVLQIWRVKRDRKPLYISSMLNPNTTNPHRTRNASVGNIQVQRSKTSMSRKSMRIRGVEQWNLLPPEIKGFVGEIQKFKKELKTWVKANVEM